VLITVLFALIFYFATLILVVGVGLRVARYARVPAPLKIPTTPAPTTRSGVVLRMGTEVLLFNSLFKANKWIWLFGFMFHVALALALLRHLRYFLDPVPQWVVFIQPFGLYASFAMVVGLGGLWMRRVFVERIRYISSPSDHLMLALLLAIALTGMGMTFVSPVDVTGVKLFFTGLPRFDFHPLPAHPLLLLHLLLVAGLMIIFPFSKLLHAPGVFFSPTRNQIDNPREKRHVSKVHWMSASSSAPARDKSA
jgi:nitrate reductase gamma subunit